MDSFLHFDCSVLNIDVFFFFFASNMAFVKETHSSLFVSVMEVLSRMISKVVDGVFLLGFLLGKWSYS